MTSNTLGCVDDPGDDADWQIVQQDLPGALLSVWGTSATDVWAVGADARDGTGPLVLHYDGEHWSRVTTGLSSGNLWWVHGFGDGGVIAGGDGGSIIRLESQQWVKMETPGIETVFGLWGASPTDVWAVGGASESSRGFAWRSDGTTWQPEPSLDMTTTEDTALWKVFGTSAHDAWLVGSRGMALHWDGMTLTPYPTGTGSSLFTVHLNGGRTVAVGGVATGVIVEYDGSGWTSTTPSPIPMGLSGVRLYDDGTRGLAVGQYGTIYRLTDDHWQQETHDLLLQDDLHAVWIDDEGGEWAVGGQTFSTPLTDGVMIYRGPRTLREDR